MQLAPLSTDGQTSPDIEDPARRALDLGLAGVMAPLVLPILLAAGLAIRVLDGGPVFHRSTRIGRGGVPFVLWKLRTVRPDPTAQDGASGGHLAARLTRTGPFLRRTRIDELPQLWNVLCGQMAMVGVRPPLPAHVAMQPIAYADLLRAPPGLTGLATLYLHGVEANRLAMARTAAETEVLYARRILPLKLRLDRIHARRRTVALDVWILARTLLAVATLALRPPAKDHRTRTSPRHPSERRRDNAGTPACGPFQHTPRLTVCVAATFAAAAPPAETARPASSWVARRSGAIHRTTAGRQAHRPPSRLRPVGGSPPG